MFAYSDRRVKFIFGAALVTCTWPLAFGQLIGAKDITEQDVQPPVQKASKADLAEKNKNYCIPNGGTADGVDVSLHRPVLTLAITKAELNANRSSLTLTATVRLKNIGDGSISVPWTDHRVASALISSKGDSQEFGITVATVDLYLGKAHSTDPMLSIEGEAALWAQQDNSKQSIQIGPGQWVDLKFEATVLCRIADPNTCLSRLRREKPKVSAWWYQRKLTMEMNGDCIYQTGAYTQLEIDSRPTKAEVNVPVSLALKKP